MKKVLNKDGFSMVEVVVAVAMLTALLYAIGHFAIILKGKMKGDTSLATVDIEKGAMAAIALTLDGLAKGACVGSALTIGTLAMPGFGTIKATTEISYAAGVDPLASAARLRCANAVFPGSQVVPGAYYFCMQFSRTTTTQNRSDLFNADDAFMEVRANLVDMSLVPLGDRGPYLSCAGYRANPSAGLMLYYRVYWHRKVQNERAHFIQNGKIIVAKP